MIKLIMLCLVLLVVCEGCGGKKPRTKYTDKSMRVMIDPDSINESHYARIQHALMKSDKFMVVDRSAGLNAVKKEQERLHRNESDRFDDKEKWAHWGKLYGVGAIVAAHAQCHRVYSWWTKGVKLECYQRLALIDANTGEAFVTAEATNDGPSSRDQDYIMPDWDDAVDELVSNYPEHFQPDQYNEEVAHYQDVSNEHAQRQREVLAAKEAAAEKAKQAAQRIPAATAPVANTVPATAAAANPPMPAMEPTAPAPAGQ